MKINKDKNHLKVWVSISGLGNLWSEESKKLSDASRTFCITFIFTNILAVITKPKVFNYLYSEYYFLYLVISFIFYLSFFYNFRSFAIFYSFLNFYFS